MIYQFVQTIKQATNSSITAADTWPRHLTNRSLATLLICKILPAESVSNPFYSVHWMGIMKGRF